jgi:hypothetical protein
MVTLALAERKRLVNLKKGDWTTVTVDRFHEMSAYLSEVEYNDGATRVSLTFTKTKLPLSNRQSGLGADCFYRALSTR